MTVEKRKSSSYKERGGVKRSWRIRAKREHHFEICTTQSKECIESMRVVVNKKELGKGRRDSRQVKSSYSLVKKE